MTKPPLIKFEDIEGIPAADLLKLSHEELDDFIKQAREISSEATNIVQWLSSIKLEKIVREENSDDDSGGAK